MPFPSQIPSPTRRVYHDAENGHGNVNGSSGSNEYGSGGFTVSQTENEGRIPIIPFQAKNQKKSVPKSKLTLAKYKIDIGIVFKIYPF